MYTNIGKKIKSWAKGACIAEAIGCLIAGLIMILTAEDGTAIAWGFLVLLGGPLAAWVSSWLLYGFGEIIEKLTEIEENTRSLRKKVPADPMPTAMPRKAVKEDADTPYTEEQLAELTRRSDAERAEERAAAAREKKIRQIAGLRDKGLITQEQYEQAVSNPGILEKF